MRVTTEELIEVARPLGGARGLYVTHMRDESDHVNGIPVGASRHPRLWGTFPRVLGHYSRDMGLFPLETAVWKMTGLTSADFGLAQRSTLKVGHPADVVVFDAKTIADVATFADPVQPARGIDAVVVNGRLAWFEGRHTGARCGQLIARGGTPTATG